MKFRYIGSLPKFETDLFSGSQAPTVRAINQDFLEVWFSARDGEKQSHPFFYFVSQGNLLDVHYIETQPQIALGSPGEPDEHGVMPSGFYPGTNYLHYTGWNRGVDGSLARYRTASMYINLDTSEKGIICDRHTQAMCGTSMPYHDPLGAYLLMNYTGWDSNKEPRYGLVEYDAYFNTMMPINQDTNYCLARPIPVEIKGNDYIMYSQRGLLNYRIDPDEMYKLMILHRDSEESEPIKVVDDPALMKAYAYPIWVRDKLFIFYNRGDDAKAFTSPIGVAVLDE